MKRLLLSAGLIASLLSCKPEQDVPVPQAGSANFASTVFIGGSTMAGYRNGALSRESQQTSVSTLLGTQMMAVGSPSPTQALLPEGDGIGLNPKPWENQYQTASQMGTRFDCEGEPSLGPVKTGFEAAAYPLYFDRVAPENFNNVAAPSFTLADWSDPQIGLATNINPFYYRFASDPGVSTMLSDAVDNAPTFFAAWPGLQDFINYASRGTFRAPFPTAATFSAELDAAMATLTANGATGVIATIPYVRDFPFFTTIPARGLTLDSARVDELNGIYYSVGLPDFFQVGDNGFVVLDTSLAIPYRQMYEDEFLCLTLPLDSVKCNLLGVLFQPIPDEYELTRNEIALLNQLVDDMNAAIFATANQYNLAVADMNRYYTQVSAGIKVDGADLNAEFATGNFFGLDGLYPSAKGSGLIANQFIEAINAHYGASLAPVRIDALDGTRFP